MSTQSLDREKVATRRDWGDGAGEVLLSGSGWSRWVNWQESSRLGTPAFWIDQTRTRVRPESYRIGASLAEETALCLLGGHGITEMMALASFQRLRDEGLLAGAPSERDLYEALSRPFEFAERPRPVKYRFPRLKAERLAAALHILHTQQAPDGLAPRALRDWLLVLPGVGMKTASWTVRNLTSSNDVAIIDIHIRRAGVAAGVFSRHWKLPKDYRRFEEAFVEWASYGGVRTADLDWCIWSWLAELGRDARMLFGVENLSDLD